MRIGLSVLVLSLEFYQKRRLTIGTWFVPLAGVFGVVWHGFGHHVYSQSDKWLAREEEVKKVMCDILWSEEDIYQEDIPQQKHRLLLGHDPRLSSARVR